MIVSLFRGPRDNRPKLRDVSWPELCRALTTWREVPAKDAAPLWSPAAYPEGATRAAAHVVAVSCLVLDFDGGVDHPEVRRRRVDGQSWMDYPHIVHTSWSHTPAHPKWRLVVPLETPYPAERFDRLWEWALRLAPECDRQCSDASRMYYLPAVSGPTHPREAWVWDDPSRLLDLVPDDLPPSSAELAAEARRRAPKPAPPPMASPDQRRRAMADRLKMDPDARLAVAERLGATVYGGAKPRADRIPCPACGRPSVFFYLEPGEFAGARCNHRDSCNWNGWIDELIALVGG